MKYAQPNDRVRLDRQLVQLESRMEAIEQQLNGFRLAERAILLRRDSLPRAASKESGFQPIFTATCPILGG